MSGGEPRHFGVSSLPRARRHVQRYVVLRWVLFIAALVVGGVVVGWLVI